MTSSPHGASDHPSPRSIEPRSTTGERPIDRARLVLLALALSACAPASSQDPLRRRSTPRTKATLFGDPALVPTRAGERARTELALAGTIQEHLAEDPQLTVLRTHVSTPPGEPAHVVLSLRGPSERTAQIQSRAETVVRAVLGAPQAQVTIDLVASNPAQEPRHAHLRPFLVVALLALGASLGITIDRLRRPPKRLPST